MKTCYIYARTATITQEEQSRGISYAINSQVQQCKRFAKQHGYTVLETFSDVASGINYKRNALQKLIKSCEKSPTDAVIVLRIDRISRSIFDYQKIKARLQKNGVELFPVCEGDLNTPVGRLISDMFASIHQYSERSESE